MKKLIVAMAVIATAAVASAGTVTWKITGVKAPTSTGAFSEDALGGAMAYLLIGTPPAGEALDDMVASFTATGDDAFAKVYSEQILKTATTSDLGAFNITKIGSYTSTDVTLYTVIFDGSSIADSNYYMISDAITQTFGTSGNKTYNFTNSDTVTVMPANWTALAPEPTSGLLMLLGMAGLALRRRRA